MANSPRSWLEFISFFVCVVACKAQNYKWKFNSTLITYLLSLLRDINRLEAIKILSKIREVTSFREFVMSYVKSIVFHFWCCGKYLHFYTGIDNWDISQVNMSFKAFLIEFSHSFRFVCVMCISQFSVYQQLFGLKKHSTHKSPFYLFCVVQEMRQICWNGINLQTNMYLWECLLGAVVMFAIRYSSNEQRMMSVLF